MKHRALCVPFLLVGVIACGKGDKADTGGGGGGGGPECAAAAAFYVDLHVKGGGNEIAGLKPTPEETKTLAAAFEADCKSRPWSAGEKACILATKDLLLDKNCFKGLDVAQVVYDSAKAIAKAREAAGGGGSAAGSGSAQ
jgi:hypothetical protein